MIIKQALVRLGQVVCVNMEVMTHKGKRIKEGLIIATLKES